MQQENIQAQSQANAQAQQAAAQAEVQKKKELVASDIQLEQAKAEMKTKILQEEAKVKKQLMDHEFELQVKMAQMTGGQSLSEAEKEDRKDKRAKMQASQQSTLIDQRQNNKPPKNFESSGNDILGGVEV